ncbi:Tat pathway signal sequence protein [Rutstroemia sp. NJR-2017a BBW]|nr:Tat pathway signal sequence protein [Rutstroemia sp. NJR-2017a BBW]
MFYEDHYYPDQSEEDRQRVRAHNIHCLESLRTSTICRPDLAPLPFYWSGNDWHQMNVSPQVKREYVDWDIFQELGCEPTRWVGWVPTRLGYL